MRSGLPLWNPACYLCDTMHSAVLNDKQEHKFAVSKNKGNHSELKAIKRFCWLLRDIIWRWIDSHVDKCPTEISNDCVVAAYLENTWKVSYITRDVPNSGFRLFGRIRIVLWTIRPKKNTNSVAGEASLRCTHCSDIYHLLKFMWMFARPCLHAA